VSEVYVSKVSSNVKSSDGLLWEVELGPRTIIVGANGKGKSRVVNAIELALTGRASDLAGRVDVAREADLMMLAPGRNSNLYACATLSTGETATFGIEYAGAGKSRKADHEVPDWFARQELLPVRAVREAMLGSADTACRAFLGWAGAGAARSVLDMLSPSLVQPYTRLTTLCPGATLPELEATARKKKLEANATVKALEAAVGRSPSVACPSDDDVTEARRNVETARAVLVKAQSYASRAQHRQRRAQMEGQLQALRAELTQAGTAYTGWSQHVSMLPVPRATSQQAARLLELLAFTVEGGDGDCLMCGSEPGVAHLRARHAAINAAVGEAMKAANEYNGAVANMNAAKAQVEQIASRVRGIEETLAQAFDLPEDGDEEVSYADAAKACDVAEERLRVLQAAKASWSTLRQTMAQLDNAKQDAVTWKGLEDALAQAGRILLTDALDGYKKRVQGFLPASDTFNLMLSEGAREVFHAGFERGGVLHTALSGAEWARLTMAMSAAILPHDALFSVLTPEERAFDPKTLTAVLKALSDAPGQVILTSPIAPAGKLPAGWTMVEL
jgi:hypothetical protein